jgi:hypothetical protein
VPCHQLDLANVTPVDYCPSLLPSPHPKPST